MTMVYGAYALVFGACLAQGLWCGLAWRRFHQQCAVENDDERS